MRYSLPFVFFLSITGVYAQSTSPMSADSLVQQAVRYEQARGVERDYEKAYALYCKAALQGHAEASYSLGWMYFNGRGLPYDRPLAMGWFKRAGKLGDRYANNMLARFPNVEARDDDKCRLPEPGPIDSRKKIESWVKVLAPRFGMDPELVMAVIGTESAFNARALSPKNAQGLMQLIPATARRFGVSDPWDPVQNMIGGIAYLHWLTRHFSGDVRLVLAGYNAGEGAVARYKGVPPYRETRHYVKRIIGQYHKEGHPVPTDLGELREFAVSLMAAYASGREGVAVVKKSGNNAI